jgi:DNA-binding CsgD family transcriptional regulator
MPLLTQEIRQAIPSIGATFHWADDTGGITNTYDENPETPRAAMLFLREFYNYRELGIGFRDTMRHARGVHSTEEATGLSHKEFLASEQYNLIARPLGYGAYIFLVVHAPGKPIGIGGLMLHRGAGERPFTMQERRRLAQLEPFLAHLVTSPSRATFPLVNSSKTGLIIATPDGQPVHASPEGLRLLFLSTHPRLSADAQTNRLPRLPPALVRICKNLTAVFAGDKAAQAPVVYQRNVWGGFTFRAHWLEGETDSAGLIGIEITFREPLLIGIIRGIEALPLTLRQSQVCRLLAIGKSYSEIARELGIGVHTAVTHARLIYDKLDVHNRSELINRLISALP